MLVLSRKKSETIRINDDIVVTVVEVRDGKVRLGVTAPRSVAVHRGEIYDKIHSEFVLDCEALPAGSAA